MVGCSLNLTIGTGGATPRMHLSTQVLGGGEVSSNKCKLWLTGLVGCWVRGIACVGRNVGSHDGGRARHSDTRIVHNHGSKASRRFVLKRVERQGDLYNQDTVACRVREVLGGIVAGQKRWYRGCTEVEDCRVRSVGGWPRINEEEAAVTWKCSTVKWHVKSEGTYDSRYNV